MPEFGPSELLAFLLLWVLERKLTCSFISEGQPGELVSREDTMYYVEGLA